MGSQGAQISQLDQLALKIKGRNIYILLYLNVFNVLLNIVKLSLSLYIYIST